MKEVTVTLETQIAELKRELAVRENVYRSWIAKGTMRQEVADSQMARMRGALHTLLELQEDALVSNETRKLARLRTEEGLP
jgi:hypothetical protein